MSRATEMGGTGSISIAEHARWFRDRINEGFSEDVLLVCDPYHPMWRVPRAWIKGYPLTHIAEMTKYIYRRNCTP